MSDTVTISELARRAGLATSTLRYYERRGLITADQHDGGARRYRVETLDRLQVVERLQTAGFSLAEIIALLDDRPDWPTHARRKRAELAERIEALTEAQQLIDAALACGCADLEGCGAAHDPTDTAARA